jgi:microcystin-dependent protein
MGSQIYPPKGGSGGGGSPYWGTPAGSVGSLPASGLNGELRLVLDTQILYEWTGAAWVIYLDPSTFATNAALTAHIGDTANPHSVTKTQVGLGNADDTSDANKPVSTAQAAADSAVQAYAIQRSNHTGTQAASTITGLAAVATSGLKADVGLGNVDDTSDANKPVSTAQAAADAAVQAAAEAYTDTAIADLVDSAPATLDTLNELAAALGDDPNFATTVSTALGNRLRVDTAAQGLTAPQKTNAKTNIDLENVDNTSDATKWAATAVVTNKDYDGGTASNTSRMTVPKGPLATLLGLTRKAATILFSTDLLKWLLDDGTVLRPMPEGEKNYCLLPSYYQAAASANDLGWYNSGGTVSNITSSLPRGVTSRSAIQFVSGSSGDYLRYRFQADDIDAGRRLKIAFAQIVAVFGDYKLEVYSGTDAALSSPTLITVQSIYTNSTGITTLPVGTIDVVSTFDTVSTRLYYEVRWTALGSSKTIKISDNIIGPGASVTHPLPEITEWQDWNLTTTTGFTTSPATNFLKWRKVGSNLELSGRFLAVTTSATEARVVLPTANMTIVTPGGVTIPVGQTTCSAGATAYPVVLAENGANYICFGRIYLTETAYTKLTGSNFTSSSSLVSFHSVSIPILEWQNQNGAISQVNASSQSPIRAGIIMPFAGSSTPTGWLDCDGTIYSQAQYPQLYAALGATWATCTNPLTGLAHSPAPTAGNFRVPDLRGVFLRGEGTFTDGIGSNTTLAGYQADQMQGHRHNVASDSAGANFYNPTSGTTAATGTTGDPVTDGTNGTPRLGKETRPRSVGVKYIVKAWDESFNLAGFAAASQTQTGFVTDAVQTLGGVKTFADGLKLDDAAGQATLNYYQEDDTSMAGVTFRGDLGGANSSGVNIRITRVGRVVTLDIPAFTSVVPTTNSLALISNTNLPTWARPAVGKALSCGSYVTSAWSATTGYLYVSTGGNLQFYRDMASTAWPNSATCGWYHTQITYTV